MQHGLTCIPFMIMKEKLYLNGLKERKAPQKMTNFRSHKSCTLNTETILFNLEDKGLSPQQELEKD